MIALTIISPSAFGSDEFGQMELNKLVLKLSGDEPMEGFPVERFRSLAIQGLPCYIILHEGRPVISETPNLKTPVPDSNQGTLEIFNLIDEPSMQNLQAKRRTGETAAPIQAKRVRAQLLHFEFANEGWNDDYIVTRITVPFSLDQTDEKEMLKISDQATIDIHWRDPKNDAVTIVHSFYGLPPKTVNVTVLENTLGFKNKLKEPFRPSNQSPTAPKLFDPANR